MFAQLFSSIIISEPDESFFLLQPALKNASECAYHETKGQLLGSYMSKLSPMRQSLVCASAYQFKCKNNILYRP